jgi:nitroreductase
MDAYECIVTKLDVRDFNPEKKVQADAKAKILEAARLTGSAKNTQHWRFILVQDRDRLKKLADDSTTGKWVAGANFAIIVLTEEKQRFHLVDAGRATQDMQIAAWNQGIVSCIFTGIDQSAVRRDFHIPQNLLATVVIGFGFPAGKVTGKRKNRKPLQELVHLENFGIAFDKRLG